MEDKEKIRMRDQSFDIFLHLSNRLRKLPVKSIKKRSVRGIKALLFRTRDWSRWNGDFNMSIF